MEKTNVMRILDQKKIKYSDFSLDVGEGMTGEEIALALHEDPNQAFKTLVTIGKSGNHYVFVIPVNRELDLKKAAKHVKEKSIEMIKQKELLPLTGYIHGGCSPIGMKKTFSTTVHESAKTFSQIYFSAGKVGVQVLVAPSDLEKVIRLTYADICVS